MKGSKYMLVHSLASKYARFVVLGRLMYWTPHQTIGHNPLLKSDDLFLGNQEILDPLLSKILDTPLTQEPWNNASVRGTGTIPEPRTKMFRSQEREWYQNQDQGTVSEPRTRNGIGTKNQNGTGTKNKNGTGTKNEKITRTKNGTGTKNQERCSVSKGKMYIENLL